MQTLRKFRVIATLNSLLILSACGGGFQPYDHDGAELVALMDNVRTILVTGDEEAWQTITSHSHVAEVVANWEDLMKMKREWGLTKFTQVLTPPELGTATFAAELRSIKLTAWYDYSTGYEPQPAAIETRWSFEREENSPQWQLASLALHCPAFEYDDVAADLNLLHPATFRLLDMDWEASPDPNPLLTRTFQALVDGDVESLKQCCVQGVIHRADQKGIQLASVAVGGGDGAYNQWQVDVFYKNQIIELRRMTKEMSTTPDALAPLFTSYPILTMPPKCTQLRLYLGYGGRGLQFGTRQVSVSWTAIWMHERWLTESMWVEYGEIATL